MSVRTVKGTAFTIVIGDQRIVIKQVYGRGKRCRVTAPPGVRIEEYLPQTGGRQNSLRAKKTAETEKGTQDAFDGDSR